MKSDYRIRAKRFLNSIFPYIVDCLNDVFEIENRISEYNSDKSRSVKVCWGSARIALVTSDYVIKWDYDEENVKTLGGCYDEWQAYLQAKDEGFDYLLAETTLIIVHGLTFSIMPRINAIGAQHHNGDITSYLSKNEYEWLIHFSADIHSYNWGIRHGKACIIDYAMTREVVERGSDWE